MKNSILYISILIQFIFVNSIVGQNRTIRFDRISIRDGLSESTVDKIFQDKQGFMWFATLDGLSRFDGKNFKVFKNIPNDSTSLSFNIVNGIAEDKNGYLWVSTNNGLNRYNPKTETFQRYFHNYKDPRSIQTNILSQNIFTDNDGNVWISYPQNWVSRIEYKPNSDNVQFIHYDSQIQKKLKNPAIVPNTAFMYQDKSGTYWIFMNDGIIKLDLSKDLNINNLQLYQPDFIDNANPIYITGVAESRNGDLWLSTFSGLLRFFPKKGIFTRYLSPDNNINALTKPFLTSIWIDKTDKLWTVISSGGLNSLDLNDSLLYKKSNPNYLNYYPKFVHYYNLPDNFKSLTNNMGFRMFEDRGGVLWISLQGGGLCKFNLYTNSIVHYPIINNSLNLVDHFVEYIIEDKAGILWAGTSNNGLVKIDKATNKFTYYLHNDKDPKSISHNRVSFILEDSKGYFWIGTDGGGLNLMDRKKGTFKHITANLNDETALITNNITSILEDSKKQIWIGTWRGGLHKVVSNDGTNVKFQRFFTNTGTGINSICEDLDHSLWLGRDNLGDLIHFNPETKKETYYAPDPQNPFALVQNNIYTVFRDHNNTIWLGTTGGGLNKMIEPEKNDIKAKFIQINENKGLCNNFVVSILEDNCENLWIATLDGISCFNPKNNTFKNFYEENGLQSNVYYRNSAFKSKSGLLYFGGSNGFNEIDPLKMKFNMNIPNIVITDFEIFNKSIKPGNESQLKQSISVTTKIILSYKDYSFSFKFAALDYSKSENNRYAYKLDGFDNEWIESGSRNYAAYTKIPPGKYVFQVKGSNNDLIWNNTGTSIILIITPPFWRTWWFYLLSITSIIGLIILYIKWRERTLKANMQQLELTVLSRTREIKDQINEIEQQRDVLEKQKKNIMDSILYAKRIQNAVLPPESLLNEILPKHFVIFMPKDVVSGDYYWISKKGKYLIIAVGDCTGHGVPGAFMSMLGIAFLNEIVNTTLENNELQANTILNQLREKVKDSLHQTGKDKETKDGMDIALCVIDSETNIMHYAGANSPLFLFRISKTKSEEKQSNIQFIEILPDKMPIGIYINEKESFNNNTIQLEIDDTIYIFSDGYIDQIGGENGRKFLKGNFKKVLSTIHNETIDIQKEILTKTLVDWKGTREQVDDILVLGIKI